MLNNILKIGVIALACHLASGCGSSGGSDQEPPDAGADPANPLGPIGSAAEEQAAFFSALLADFIAPGYSNAASEMQALNAEFVDFCTSSSTDDSSLRSAWLSAMASWQAIQWVDFGPITTLSVPGLPAIFTARMRIQFFPDANGIAVVNNTNALLDGSDEVTQAFVSTQPVGAQGLPALEFMLFDLALFQSGVEDQRACDVAVGITENLVDIFDSLAASWSEGGEANTAFETQTGQFSDTDASLQSIFESLVFHAELIADAKLLSGINGTFESFESWRSESSLENIQVNFSTLESIYDNGDAFGLSDLLFRAFGSDLVDEEFNNSIADINEIIDAFGGSLEAVEQGLAEGELEALETNAQRVAESLALAAEEAGVSLGFNSLDGD